jgi:hypothetical protein
MSVDLDAKTSVLEFVDTSSNSFTSSSMAWSPSITDTTVQTLNLQMVDGVGKNYYDDFSFSLTASAVPEPSSLVVALTTFCALAIRRRRS